jgi:peptide chain release factor 1
MWDKLKEVEKRFEELTASLSAPDIASDPKRLMQISKEHKDLQPVVQAYRAYIQCRTALEGNKEIIQTSNDADLVELAQDEIPELQEQLDTLAEELRLLLLPKDPNDDKNIILEIRAGAGGDEAAIFAGDLFRMYTRYAEGLSWRVEMLSFSEASSGGYKEIIGMITGNGAFSRFKYESGVHRVQRVPVTETQGRVHTSTATVAVLPEAEDVDVQINDKDLRIDVYRAGGPGGQSVNTTDSAVRITHLPTGVVVAMQDEKSQTKNKEKALKVLRSRILEKAQAEADAERRDTRRGQVGTGDRSEKIRTYNYPQSRITDHRIGLTVHALEQVMGGDLDQIVNPLITYHQAEALKQGNIAVGS